MSNPRTIRVKTPGKMILTGEYAVLEGGPALVAAVNRFCYADFHIHNHEYYTVSAPNIGVQDTRFHIDRTSEQVVFETSSDAITDKLRLVKETFEYFQRELHMSVPFCAVSIDTDEFYDRSRMKIGLGSSAAVTTALAAGLSHIAENFKWSQHDLYSHALSIHRNAQHGRGSGIDIAASTFGGVLRYQLDQHDHARSLIKPIPPAESLFMIPVWTGSSASTSALIQKLSRRKTLHPERYATLMDHMTSLSEKACAAYTDCNSALFLESINSYFNAMVSLGTFIDEPVISPEHSEIRDLVCSAGGVYKPSGAGMGDIGLAFAGSQEIQESVVNALAHTSYPVLDLSVAGSGTEMNMSMNNVTQDM